MKPVTHRPLALSRIALAALSALVLSTAACGPAAPPVAPPVNPALAIDADPLSLFPAGAIALASLDVRAFYASGSTGGQLASFGEGVLPVGQEVGMSVSRDVDHIFIGVYASGGVDAVAVASGRFDIPRLQAAVAAHVTTKTGAAWVAFPYAGRTLYTVSNVAFAPVTDHTMVSGSESAVRRVLDRLAIPSPQARPRELADWMIGTVAAQGSAFAIAADIASIPPQALHGLPMPTAMNGLSRAAVIGDFNPPGLNVGSTLTYADPERAAAGGNSIRQLAAFVNMAAAMGAAPKVQNLSITPEGVNVAVKFALDDEAIRKSMASVIKLATGSTAPPR
jgi:hypothetical protein